MMPWYGESSLLQQVFVSSPKTCWCACRLRVLGCWVLLAWLAKEVGGCFVSLFASLRPGLSIGKYQPDCDAADLEKIVLQTWGKWMAGEKLVLALLSHRSVGYRRTSTAAGCYKCPGNRILETVFTIYQGMHALTKDSFPVWVASRKLLPGWNIHRFALLCRP